LCAIYIRVFGLKSRTQYNCTKITSKMYAISNMCLALATIMTAISITCVHCDDHRNRTLRGVTIVSEPFVMRTPDNQFYGFAVDLLNEIARTARFTYSLYPSPDERYGTPDNKGKQSGMVQELVMRRADFIIADLIKTEIRERYIDFSVPFMNLEINALINKKNVGNMTSLEDLVNQNRIKFGTLREGETYRYMSMSPDPIINRVNHYIYSNAFNLVDNRREGVERALNSEYAFIAESTFNEYTADQNCELTVIRSNPANKYLREYGVGLQKQSLWKHDIDRAINQLTNDGTLKKLKSKYWKTKCMSAAITAKLDLITTISLVASALISFVLFN